MKTVHGPTQKLGTGLEGCWTITTDSVDSTVEREVTGTDLRRTQVDPKVESEVKEVFILP